MAILLRDEHVTIEFKPAFDLVRVTRSAAAYPSLEAFERSMNTVNRLFLTLDRPRLAILLDSRSAPMNTDPAIEKAITARWREMRNGFRRAAILMRSAVGHLQAARRVDPGTPNDAAVFNDEAAALAFLEFQD